MKPTAVPFTVILILGSVLFVGYSFNAKKQVKSTAPLCELILPEIPLKEEKTAPLPQPEHKEANSPKAVKIKQVKPLPGTIKVEGDDSHCGAPPPIPEDDIILSKVEIEAEYPGGAAAWQRFLNRNLRVPQDVIDNELYGSVMVQFVVDKEGNVSNVEGVSGQEAMCAEAVRVIKKSGKWAPAVQNGRYVKSLKKQPFIICFEVEE